MAIFNYNPKILFALFCAGVYRRKFAFYCKFWDKINILILLSMLTFVGIINATESQKDTVNISSNQMEMLEKGKVIAFSGKVKIVQKNVTIYADKVWHYLQEGKIIGEGNIRCLQIKDKEQTEVTGGRITYDKNKKYGQVSINPKLTRTIENDARKNVTLTCEIIDVYFDQDKAQAIGNVEIQQPDSVAKSKIADYYDKEKKIVLTDEASVWQKTEENTSLYTGDIITVFLNEEKVKIEGNVQAKVTPNKSRGNF